MGLLTSRANSSLITRVSLAAFSLTQNLESTGGFHRVTTPDSTAFYLEECTVQPIKTVDLKALPEGVRDEAFYIVYTDTKVKTVEEGTETLADHVSIYGNTYKCYRSERWQNSIRNHYKVYLVKVDKYGPTVDDFIDTPYDEYTNMDWSEIDDQDDWEDYWRSE
jgi:hypothetical protein